MLRVGIDIIEISRIRQAISRWGQSFLGRIYTPSELELCDGRAPTLAARFAAKEAVMKALGPQGLGWRDIEVLADSKGAPQVYLHGQAGQRAQELGVIEVAISLAHSRYYAIASVVAETP